MKTYVILDAEGKVANRVTWDGDLKNWQPPAGHTAVLAEEFQEEPVEPEPEKEPEGGFLILPEKIRVKDDDSSITVFANYLTGLVLAAQTPDDADVTFYDFFDKPQVLKMQRWREVMAGYFGHVTAKKGLS